MNRPIFLLGATAALATLTAAQPVNPVTGPGLGFSYDRPSQSLREVTGSLGAATLSRVIFDNLDFASAAAKGGHAIACERDGCFTIAGLGTPSPERTPLTQIEMPEGAAWSGDGKTVALYSVTGQWVRVIHLDGSAAPEPLNIASLGGTLTSAALNSDGARLWLGLSGDRTGVFEVTHAGAFVPVLDALHPAALTVQGTKLYVLDASTRTVYELDGGVLESWPVEAAQDAVDLRLGRDAAGRSVLYAADRSGRALFVYDGISHALIDTIALNFEPTGLEVLTGGSYLLNARANSGDLLWSYAAGRGLFFVPVTPQEIVEQEPTIARRRIRR